LRLLKEFPSFCSGDDAVYFRDRVPKKIGIGLSRGVASRLSSGKKTLDYSGRPLNLASRLMDKARPSGIVFDGSVDINLLSKASRRLFRRGTTYVRGIHGETPIEVYSTRDVVLRKKEPVAPSKFKTESRLITVNDIRSIDSAEWRLVVEPLNPRLIQVEALLPQASAKYRRMISINDFRYVLKGDLPTIAMRYLGLRKRLRRAGLTNHSRITIRITYPVS
jgi:hypothetical protein